MHHVSDVSFELHSVIVNVSIIIIIFIIICFVALCSRQIIMRHETIIGLWMRASVAKVSFGRAEVY
jgi:hypothetical protein